MQVTSTSFGATLENRLPFLQRVEDSLRGKTPVIYADVSEAGTRITTPLSLQHVGMQIVESAKCDWTAAAGLRNTVIPYLTELIEFWEAVFERHQQAASIFAAARGKAYCLLLRSFSGVTHPIEVPGARVVMYVTDPELDANLAATLMTKAKWLNPVTCMHTDDMQLLARLGPAMPAFRVRTLNWQTILSDAIASSGSIIFYLSGRSAGVDFEIDRIRELGLDSRTVVVYRGDTVPVFAASGRYADVLPVSRFLTGVRGKTGPGVLTKSAERLLRDLAVAATTRAAPSQRLQTMPCEIVDSGEHVSLNDSDARQSYFVTSSNAAAFVSYVNEFPDSLMRWNAISQQIRLNGIQPDIDDFNALYTSLRMTFVSAACLGFTSSVACAIGLLAKVASMVKHSRAENRERVDLYMSI